MTTRSKHTDAQRAANGADVGPIAVVAEDDEFFRMAVSALLTRQLGFAHVVETGSLDEALAALADLPTARLALFDLRMPGMAGAASLGAVRECFPSVKVVMLSASIERVDVLTALAAGCHGYVPKTFGAADVVKALAMILDGGIYVPPFLADLPPAGTPMRFAPEPESPLAVNLTRRQREVLELIVAGRSNKAIARTLVLGEGTVKVHVAALLRTLAAPNRAAAAVSGAELLQRELVGRF